MVGPPGSGKTVLAQQYVFYLTPPRAAGHLPDDRVGAAGEGLALRSDPGLFDATVGRAVHYEDVGGLFGSKGLSAVVERADALLKEYRPAIIVIDSFKALTPTQPTRLRSAASSTAWQAG